MEFFFNMMQDNYYAEDNIIAAPLVIMLSWHKTQHQESTVIAWLDYSRNAYQGQEAIILQWVTVEIY